MLLAIGASVATWALSTVRPANLGVTRIIGAPYIVSADFVRNQFLVRVVNKRNQPARFRLILGEAPRELRQTGLTSVIEVGALGEIAQPLVLQIPRSSYTGPFNFEIRVQDEAGTFHLERKAEFLGPEARLLREDEEEEKREHKK